ncbi:TetR family transcriptional regulator [Dongia mobilis]|uniref:TetR family transcriptional regulator n=1 Tax=Dongia mobilis TaxID=578943 RepID=A0A4R6WPZ8_9PROT|nr:TetR/AcrR family transcriptional regulator [Dongia mobilis]TDQ83185.1 TetR family transcriptional regulator [Dongia mobilis]
MGKGVATRERLMDIAEAAILQKGFAGTSIEELIAEAGITKSGFFYHFRDKNQLAQRLLERHLQRDETILDDVFGRARELTDDPLHTLLVGLKLLAELMADLKEGHPGCLVATYCYNERLFDQDLRDLNRQAVLAWRIRFRAMIDAINLRYLPREEIDPDHLADMISTMVEGGIVMSKVLRAPLVLPQQILLLRSYIRLLYCPNEDNNAERV